MRLLWFLNRSGWIGEFQPVGYYGDLEKFVEEVLGKNNVAFYGTKDLPKICEHKHTDSNYSDSPPHYPNEFNFIDRGIDSIISDERPDIIIIDNSFYNKFDVSDLKNAHDNGVSIVSFMTDAHTEWKSRKSYVEQGVLDMIATRYYGGGIGHKIRNDLKCVAAFSPPSVSTEMYYDRRVGNLEREYDVYLSGGSNLYYPIRVMMHYSTVLQHTKPTELKFGQSCYKNLPKRMNTRTFSFGGLDYLIDFKLIGINEYIKNLNMSKILAFDTSVFRYALRKFFEGMACNTLVMSDLPYDWLALRLQPNINMVQINIRDFLEKFKHYKESNERKKIARNGMELVEKYHNSRVRAEQLVSQLNELINSRNEGRAFDSRSVKGEAGRQLSILENTPLSISEKYSMVNSTMEYGSMFLDSWTAEVTAFWNECFKNKNFNGIELYYVDT